MAKRALDSMWHAREGAYDDESESETCARCAPGESSESDHRVARHGSGLAVTATVEWAAQTDEKRLALVLEQVSLATLAEVRPV